MNNDLESVQMVNITIFHMLRELPLVEKFIFCYVFLLGFEAREAAELLGVHKTNVSRHVRKMRKRLVDYKMGSEDDFSIFG